MTREPIYQAVLEFWQALTLPEGTAAFRTATRNAKMWDQVPPEETPALLQMQSKETAERRRGLPTKWTLRIKLMLYVTTQNISQAPNVTPSEIFNPLVDAVEAALVIDDIANNACTLGGLVSHCAIEGDIEIYEGSLGDTAVVVVPILIVVSP